MNVLLLSQFFSTTKGGGEYVFKTIANNLVKNKNNVWVITNKVKEEEYQESENLKIITVKPELEYKGSLPPTFAENIQYVINTCLKGTSLVRKEKIDIIHSNNFSPAFAGSLISSITRAPHITTVHDIFSTAEKNFWQKWASQPGASKVNARLVPFFERLMMRFKFDCIHTVSDATKNDILFMNVRKPIIVIPNCIEERPPVKSELKKNQFVYVGRLIFYKNIEIVLQAFQIVRKEFPDARLIIAGDGPHRKYLEEFAKNADLKNNIRFRGYVSPEEKMKLISESNAMLFPSLYEGFGLVILEAFSQKRPVLASNIPPMSDIIQNEKTGYLIEPHNGKSWAEKIINLIKEPDISQKMGETGYQILQKKYSQEIFYQNIIKMYQDVSSGLFKN